MGETLMAQAPCAPGHCPAERSCLRSDIWREGTVVTASCYH